uniref:Uncharacterized protein n=1 Tax=Oryza glaberrima TaxID=4538 RepID=I1QPD6_ORYGL
MGLVISRILLLRDGAKYRPGIHPKWVHAAVSGSKSIGSASRRPTRGVSSPSQWIPAILAEVDGTARHHAQALTHRSAGG